MNFEFTVIALANVGQTDWLDLYGEPDEKKKLILGKRFQEETPQLLSEIDRTIGDIELAKPYFINKIKRAIAKKKSGKDNADNVLDTIAYSYCLKEYIEQNIKYFVGKSHELPGEYDAYFLDSISALLRNKASGMDLLTLSSTAKEYVTEKYKRQIKEGIYADLPLVKFNLKNDGWKMPVPVSENN